MDGVSVLSGGRGSDTVEAVVRGERDLVAILRAAVEAMTVEERALLVALMFPEAPIDLEVELKRHLRETAHEERERCAKLIETPHDGCGDFGRCCAANAAAAIRSLEIPTEVTDG